MDITKLVNMTSRAWSLKILALLHQGVPGRQAPLLAAAQASRTSFVASLNHLIDLKLMERNPGHGHPLRPEFRLTAEGHRFAPYASEIVQAAEQSDDRLIVIQKTWTVPILAATKEPRRFSEVKSTLPMVNDRALSQSLDLLQKNDWLRREVDTDCRPPRPIYQAQNAGLDISRIIDSMPLNG